VQLGQFVDHLRLQRREPDARLKEALELVLEPLSERADTSLVPPPDELQRLSYVEGGWPGALQEAMNRIRSELTHRLLGLDAPLRETFGEAKEGLRQAIVVPGLRLGEPFIGDNAWQNLAQRAQEADCPELAKGFGFVANFALTYFGFIHHRIREALDPLTPDARPLPPISTGPDAHEFLWDAVEHAVFQMRKQLAGLLAEPTMARFAMAEEFKDQAVRREGVDDEWERFTSAYRDVLWPGSFLQAEGEAALYKRWTEAVQQVERVAATVAALGGQPA
jgi:hypothetical protein